MKTKQTTDTQNASSTNPDQQRRKLIALAGAASATAVWHKPVIDAVILPAHAVTTGTGGGGGGGGGSEDTGTSGLPGAGFGVELAADADGGVDITTTIAAPASATAEQKREMVANKEIEIDLNINNTEGVSKRAVTLNAKTNTAGVARVKAEASSLNMVAGDRVTAVARALNLKIANVSARSEAAVNVKAGASFAMSLGEVAATTASISTVATLKGAINSGEKVAFNLESRDASGAFLSAATISVAAKASERGASAALKLDAAAIKNAGLKLAERGSLSVQASMARAGVFNRVATEKRTVSELKAAASRGETTTSVSITRS